MKIRLNANDDASPDYNGDIIADDDAYWLRMFAGMAMQGLLAGEGGGPVSTKRMIVECILDAQALLSEIKRVEAENK